MLLKNGIFKMVILVTFVKVFFLLSLFVDSWKLLDGWCWQCWTGSRTLKFIFVTLVQNCFNFVWSVNKHFGNCGYVFVQSPSAAQVEVPLALHPKPETQAIAWQPHWPLHWPPCAIQTAVTASSDAGVKNIPPIVLWHQK